MFARPQLRRLDPFLEARVAAETARRTALETVSQVWDSYHGVQTSLEKFRARGARLAASQETFTLTRVAYDSGLANFLDLETAQRDLADARLEEVRARAGVATSLVELAHSTGTLFPREPIPVGEDRP